MRSQVGEGWTLLPDRYDDSGYSGGTLRRPGLERLRADIRAGRIDLVVVYKVDRLTRSLRDFAVLVSELEEARAAFVAVTQSIDTSTSTGRLMLNVLLSFAQFEREMTGDRLRDVTARARSEGRWTGGPRPYGYDVSRGVLTPNRAEAQVVRYMFARYLELGSLAHVAEDVSASGALNRKGRAWDAAAIGRVLENRLYQGDLPHYGVARPGRHEPLVSDQLWQDVQRLRSDGARIKALQRKAPVIMLADLVRTHDGVPLKHVCSSRGLDRYHYYKPRSQGARKSQVRPEDQFRAQTLEKAVTDAVGLGGENIGPRRSTPDETSKLVRERVGQVILHPDRMEIVLRSGDGLFVVRPPPIREDRSRPPRTLLAPPPRQLPPGSAASRP